MVADYTKRLEEGWSTCLNTIGFASTLFLKKPEYLPTLSKNDTSLRVVWPREGKESDEDRSVMEQLILEDGNEQEIVVYNSLNWYKTEFVRVKISSFHPDKISVYTVSEFNDYQYHRTNGNNNNNNNNNNKNNNEGLKKIKEVSILPAVGAFKKGSSEEYHLYFKVSVPPLSLVTFLIRQEEQNDESFLYTTKNFTLTELKTKQSSDVSINNSFIEVHPNLESGFIDYIFLKQQNSPQKGKKLYLRQNYVEYTTARSGAYIMRTHSRKDLTNFDRNGSHITVLQSKHVSEIFLSLNHVKGAFRNTLHVHILIDSLSSRIYLNHRYSVPGNHEFVLEFGPQLQNAEDAFFTTFDGVDFTNRTFGSAKTNPKSSVVYTRRFVDEGIADNQPETNYYPCLGSFTFSSATFDNNNNKGGGGGAGGQEVQVHTRHSHGIRMSNEHKIEMMLGRHLSQDDGRGLGESVPDTSKLSVWNVLAFPNSLGDSKQQKCYDEFAMFKEKVNWNHKLILLQTTENKRKPIGYFQQTFKLVSPLLPYSPSQPFPPLPASSTSSNSKVEEDSIYLLALKTRDAVSDEIVLRIQNGGKRPVPIQTYNNNDNNDHLNNQPITGNYLLDAITGLNVNNFSMKTGAGIRHVLESSEKTITLVWGIEELEAEYKAKSQRWRKTRETLREEDVKAARDGDQGNAERQNTDEEGVFISDKAREEEQRRKKEKQKKESSARQKRRLMNFEEETQGQGGAEDDKLNKSSRTRTAQREIRQGEIKSIVFEIDPKKWISESHYDSGVRPSSEINADASTAASSIAPSSSASAVASSPAPSSIAPSSSASTVASSSAPSSSTSTVASSSAPSSSSSPAVEIDGTEDKTRREEQRQKLHKQKEEIKRQRDKQKEEDLEEVRLKLQQQFEERRNRNKFGDQQQQQTSDEQRIRNPSSRPSSQVREDTPDPYHNLATTEQPPPSNQQSTPIEDQGNEDTRKTEEDILRKERRVDKMDPGREIMTSTEQEERGKQKRNSEKLFMGGFFLCSFLVLVGVLLYVLGGRGGGGGGAATGGRGSSSRINSKSSSRSSGRVVSVPRDLETGDTNGGGGGGGGGGAGADSPPWPNRKRVGAVSKLI